MVVETGSLCERLITHCALVRLVTRMDSAVGFQGGRLPESFATNFTTERPHSVVASHVSNHAGFVTKFVFAYRALERFFARMLSKMVLQMNARLESFRAH